VTDDAHPAAPTPDGASAPAGPAAGPKPAMPEYKGDELDAERGPGLGCFWLQVILLVFFVVFTPLTVELGWPPIVSAILLFVTLGLLLFVGQTVIFLLRIVAAERRGRRRPVAARTRTVGEIEEGAAAGEASPTAEDAAPPTTRAPGTGDGVEAPGVGAGAGAGTGVVTEAPEPAAGAGVAAEAPGTATGVGAASADAPAGTDGPGPAGGVRQ
jgi:hypothetical protein